MKKKEISPEMVSEMYENGKHIRMDRRTFMKLAGLGAGALAFGGLSSRLASASRQVPLQVPLPGTAIPKYIDPLPVFGPAGPIARVTAAGSINVSMELHSQQVLTSTSGVGPTNLWAYNVGGITNYPAVTLEATRNIPAIVTYTNNLTPTLTHDLYKLLTVDRSLHWANPLGDPMMVNNPNPPPTMIGNPAFYNSPVPACVHLHGAEVESASDGGPDAWFTPLSTPGGQKKGPGWTLGASNVCIYPNTQEAAILWFHDHALGATRLNVYAGMAGFYLLRDWNNENNFLPGGPSDTGGGKYEIEIVIQDRMFDTTGQLFFPDIGINPLLHPYWIPEFFGDTIVVNGKTWPYLNVDARRYRLRLLNGSNARFYDLSFANGMTFYQIGTDGGLMNAPVPLKNLVIAPGERADIIVDFALAAGNPNLLLTNKARTPYPGGRPVYPQTTGQIMQFRVGAPMVSVDPSYNPAIAGTSPRVTGTTTIMLTNGLGLPLVTPSVTRHLTLNEVMGAGGPLEILVNNTKWTGLMSPRIATDFPVDGVSELPKNGATEVWEIINLTVDTHPIHLHLVQFQLLNRQPFQLNKYMKAYNALFPGGINPADGLTYPPGVFMPAYGPPLPYGTGALVGGNPDITPYLNRAMIPPAPNEVGWKDTVQMNPGEVTRIVARWMPTDVATGASGSFTAIDPTTGPGYVWHCHILDHEDNEMMRPYKVLP